MNNYKHNTIFGLRVIETQFLLETKLVNRSWRERLFSKPWHPCLKSKVIRMPAPYALKIGNDIYIHPAYKDRIVELINAMK